MRYCRDCGTRLSPSNASGLCQACYRVNRAHNKVEEWLKTGNTGYTVNTTIRGPIRKYMLEKQEHKCAICGMVDIWNNKKLQFVLDHIDGDAANSAEDNLRLICPNCDSQLPTFKSKNKHSARTARKH